MVEISSYSRTLVRGSYKRNINGLGLSSNESTSHNCQLPNQGSRLRTRLKVCVKKSMGSENEHDDLQIFMNEKKTSWFLSMEKLLPSEMKIR